MEMQGLRLRIVSPRGGAGRPQRAESGRGSKAPIPRRGLGQAHQRDGRDQVDPRENRTVPKVFFAKWNRMQKSNFFTPFSSWKMIFRGAFWNTCLVTRIPLLPNVPLPSQKTEVFLSYSPELPHSASPSRYPSPWLTRCEFESSDPCTKESRALTSSRKNSASP